MRKNIKADKERTIIKEEYINDNSLLEATLEDNREVTLTIRFVKSPIEGIKEHFLTKMTIYDFLSETDFNNFLKISEDNSAIAIFKEVPEGFQLERLYDTEEHSFALDEFIDIVYKEKFPELALNKHLVLKRTN